MYTEKISMMDSSSIMKESVYLIISNRAKCRELLSKKELTENEIIDFYISLHLVLEVGLNTLFRNLSLLSIKKDVSKEEIIKNIDNIGFREKTTLFIYIIQSLILRVMIRLKLMNTIRLSAN